MVEAVRLETACSGTTQGRVPTALVSHGPHLLGTLAYGIVILEAWECCCRKGKGLW